MDEQSLRPWNWCDRRCERCPLSLDCREAILDDDAPLLIGELDIIEAEPEPTPISAEGNEFADAGARYLDEIEHLCTRAMPEDCGLASEARLIAMVIMTRSAGVMHRLPLAPEAASREDAVLTLLLISHLEKQAAALVMAIGAEWRLSHLLPYRRARRDLRRLLDVHLRGMKQSEHAVVDGMIRNGRAPSPFCVTAGPPIKAA